MEKVTVKFSPDIIFCPECDSPMFNDYPHTWVCLDMNCKGYSVKYKTPTLELERAEE